jgi:hypothetical protein
MVYPLSYQLYNYERGLTAAEQRAADACAGEAAAAVRDLRVRLGRSFRLRQAPRAAGPRGGGHDDRSGTVPVERPVEEGQCVTC